MFKNRKFEVLIILLIFLFLNSSYGQQTNVDKNKLEKIENLKNDKEFNTFIENKISSFNDYLEQEKNALEEEVKKKKKNDKRKIVFEERRKRIPAKLTKRELFDWINEKNTNDEGECFVLTEQDKKMSEFYQYLITLPVREVYKQRKNTVYQSSVSGNGEETKAFRLVRKANPVVTPIDPKTNKPVKIKGVDQSKYRHLEKYLINLFNKEKNIEKNEIKTEPVNIEKKKDK